MGALGHRQERQPRSPELTRQRNKSYLELQEENKTLRQELRVAREAAEITAELVVRQFEQTEQVLRRFQEANAQRQAVLDAASQMSIISTDLQGTIHLFNRGASNLLGYTPRQVVGRVNILSLHLRHELWAFARGLGQEPVHGEAGMEIFEQCVQKGSTEARDWRYVRSDGTLLPVSLSVTPLQDAEGRMSGYLFTAMDMTEHNRLEQELVQAKEEAEQANASKGDFLARMSHEIRTPMNAVVGMASLLQNTELDPKQQDYVQKIIFSANTLLGLINDILDFSKIDAGKLELEEIAFDLEEVLGNLINVVGLRAEEKGLELLFHVDSDVPRYLIGDPLRLGQVLMNLCSNAVKFTEQGEIVVRVSRQQDLDTQVQLLFSVSDTGIGLTQEQTEHLFQAFQQADGSFSRKFGGTGLGLAICKELTEMMGGEIWVQSEPGQGSRFLFSARFAKQEDAGGQEASISQSLRGLRVMVVDDNQTSRQVLHSMLSSWNMQVECVQNGAQAVERLKQAARQGEPFDVVLLDWVMPDMDGIETARQIKREPQLAALPALLMVTAYAREEARVQAEKEGLQAFLPKPVYPSVLFDHLLQIFGRESGIQAWKSRPEDYTNQRLQVIQGSRILLVEDNPLNQQVGREFLQAAGLEVEVAENGLQALEALQGNDYDLVLMDIQLPDMDGLEATRHIRGDSRFQDLPIVALTAHALESDTKISLEAGMNDHLNKPIQPEALYQSLLKWIPAKQSQEQPAEMMAKADVVEEAQSEQDAGLDLPLLPGLELREALKRLNDNTRLLLSMVQEFLKAYSTAPAWLQEQAEAGRWQEIRTKAHTLKGSAAYIGAVELQQAATALEQALKQEEDEDHAWELLQSLLPSLEKALESLGQLELFLQQRESPGGWTPRQTSDFEDKNNLFTAVDNLQQLEQRLSRGELVEEELLAATGALLSGADLEAKWARLLQLIDDIELEAAAQIAAELLDQVQKSGQQGK